MHCQSFACCCCSSCQRPSVPLISGFVRPFRLITFTILSGDPTGSILPYHDYEDLAQGSRNHTSLATNSPPSRDSDAMRHSLARGVIVELALPCHDKARAII